MSDKKTLRKVMAARRAEAAATVDPGPALRALEEILAETEGGVSFFWPIRTEIDPRPVMQALAPNRIVSLPMTHKAAALTFRPWRPGAAMITDGFGVSVPDTVEEVRPAVLVVPLLAFDERLHRLGYGAGHYDRTLAELRAAGPVTAIGLAFEAQLADAPLPIEATDQPLDMLVTEQAIRRI